MVFDSHTHIFPEHVVDRAMEALTERYGARPIARATPDGLLRHMDESGVDRALVLGVATKPSQVHTINDWITSLGEPRLVPFGSLHPYADDIADEIERLLDLGVKGVKLQPHFQGYGLDDPLVYRMFELIGERLIVLMHGGQEIIPIENLQPTPRRLLHLHETFPEVRFILAHLGGYLEWDGVEEMLVGRDLHLDASYIFGICPDERIGKIMRDHGLDKVVWGSDFPWQTQSEGLEGMARLELSGEERAGLIGGNLRALLGEG